MLGGRDKRALKHNRKRQITRTILPKKKDAEGEIRTPVAQCTTGFQDRRRGPLGYLSNVVSGWIKYNCRRGITPLQVLLILLGLPVHLIRIHQTLQLLIAPLLQDQASPVLLYKSQHITLLSVQYISTCPVPAVL